MGSKGKRGNDVSDGKTLFVRNISFDTEQEDLEEAFAEFGDLEYCLLCEDRETGHSKGTAFVKFKDQDSVSSVLAASNVHDEKLTVDGRRLNVVLALPRKEVEEKKQEKDTKERDKRNLYLAKEGLIYADSPAAEGMSQKDLEKRLTLEQKKRKLLQNITNFVSRKRLCIHNLPDHVDDKKLRAIFIATVDDSTARIVEARVMRNYNNLTQKLEKSKHFGFVEFEAHEHALKALRLLNNSPETFSSQSRPIVEFSIESKIALNKRTRNKLKNVAKRESKKGEGAKKDKEGAKDQKNQKQKNSKDLKAENRAEAVDHLSEGGEEEVSVKPNPPKSKAKRPKPVDSDDQDDNDDHEERQPSLKGKRARREREDSDDQDDAGDDEEHPNYSGVRSHPLRDNEKVAAPKLNRKIYETKKKLKERRKQLKREEKMTKRRKEHTEMRTLKTLEKQSLKKKEAISEPDLESFERDHLQRRAKEQPTVRSFSKAVASKPTTQRSKWFVSDSNGVASD